MRDGEEIRAVIDSIAKTFSKLDIAAWLQNFHSPRMMVTPAACMTPVSVADAEILLGPLLDSLRAAKFDRTEVDTCSVHQFTPNSAIASVAFTRYAGNEVLESLGGTYFLQKRDGRWGVLLVAVHGSDATLSFA